MFTERFNRRLAEQKQSGLYRNPPQLSRRQGKYIYIGHQKLLNFSSNDYLGLGASPELRQRVAANFRSYGSSASSSRLVSGNYATITRAEQAYADYFGYETCLFFPSGYQANIGLISTFFEKGDSVFFDKHVHASTIKGLRLSRTAMYGFNHASMPHLKKRLETHRKIVTKKSGKEAIQPAVLTESLFSMDGDFLDTRQLIGLKKEYGFLCVVDEAHAFGVIDCDGKKGGRGLAGRVADVSVGTLGKAFGLFGAFALMPASVREYVLNFCSPLIYSTTLPEAHAASAMDALHIIMKSDRKREYLTHLSQLMKGKLLRDGFHVSGDAHILAVLTQDETLTMTLASKLCDRGVFVFPARYPTVPLGKAVLRIGLTTMHTEADVDMFILQLKEAYGRNNGKST